MGFSLTAAHVIIGVSLLLALEVLLGAVIPTFSDLDEAYDDMVNRSIDQMQTRINIESLTSGGGKTDEWNNSVDSNLTDVDSSPDIGNETNFPNAQDTTADGDFMTIQENETGTFDDVEEWLTVTSHDATYQNWDQRAGADPYIDTVDDDEARSGSYLSERNTDSATEGWFIFSNTAETGSGLTVNFTFRCDSDDGDTDGFYVYYDETGIGPGTQHATKLQVTATTYAYYTLNLAGTFTATEVNNMRIYLSFEGNDDVYVDYCRMEIYRAGSPNYEIDLEYNWTTANYSEDNKMLCIYVESHTGSEDLNVNYRNGDSWTNLGTISSTGWNNFTATGLTSQFYTIQLIGTSETSDSSQDSWDIDCIFLYTWNSTGGGGLNITVKNIGDSILKTEGFSILINGELKSFTTQKSFIDLNNETDFFVDIAVSDGDVIKVIADNGISDYIRYTES